MDLRFELEALEDILFNTLHPARLVAHASPNTEIARFANILDLDYDSFQKKIRQVIGRLIDKAQRAAYIQLQQSGIIQMMDVVALYLLPKDQSTIDEKKRPVTAEDLYVSMYKKLESLLHFLKYNYDKEFDFDFKMPDEYKLSMESGIKETVLKIENLLKKKVNAEFLNLLIEPFKKFLSPLPRCNYREFKYLQELQLLLLDMTEKSPKNIEEEISLELFAMNFNSVSFFNYYKLKVSEEASKKNTITERLEYLSWQTKIINQAAINPNAIYLPDRPPIAEQLLFWISEDIYYLERKQQLTMALPLSREAEKDKQKKVHVQLTVADLALGARLLLDTGVISDIKYTELMKLIAKNFRTNRQANISQQAIYNVGFEISLTSKEKMKEILMKMVRSIGEY